MPRGPKKTANQHNSRHENGVVAPGKRINKQKSNGLLDGNPEGGAAAAASTAEHTPPVPSVSPGILSQQQHHHPQQQQHQHSPVSSHANGSANHPAVRSPGSKQESRRSFGAAAGVGAAGAGEDSNDASSRLEGAFGEKMAEQNHRRIDISAPRPTLQYDGSLFPLAMTVLTSCPLRDTLAILIFLLSLPPTIATITNAMFALLTFVPPSGSFTMMFTMMPTISDITSSFSPGTPSLIVTVLIDAIAMWLWVWLPKDVQALSLDAAQAMVATTLGGGYNYKPGANDNTLLCVSIVACTHLARYRPLIMKQLHRTYLGRWAPLWGEYDDTFIDRRYPVGERDWMGTIKVMIALHIVCQGFTRLVRRLLHPSRHSVTQPPTSTTSTTRTVDQEASVGYPTGTEPLEHSQNPPHSPMELRPRGSVQNMREARERISSGKRRRKQANYVRSQQPFWAAFAATKATIMREYEMSRANTEAASSKATDIKNFGNAPFEVSENRVWITALHETSFYFETSALPNSCESQDCDLEEDSGIDRSKPLYVSCNGMEWSAARLEPIPNTADDYKRCRWAGEVSMLSPGKTYQVCFLRCDDDYILHSETVATLPAPELEQPSTVTPTRHARPASPASPNATLRSSITVFEGLVKSHTEQRNQARKDNKTTVNGLRRELDLLNERMTKHASMDKNLKNRQNQQAQQMRQADDAIAAITKELESITEIPEEESVEWKERKSVLEAARAEMTAAQQEHMRIKESNYKAYAQRNEEEMNARHKRERLQGRLDRLNKQYKRLMSPSEEDDSNGKNRSNSDPSIKGPSHGHGIIEEGYRQQIKHLMHAVPNVGYQRDLYREQINALNFAAAKAQELAAQEQQAAFAAAESRPITPEGDLPGTNPTAPPSSAGGTGGGLSRYSGFGTPESSHISMANGHHTYSGTYRGSYGFAAGRSDSTRARSTSGMSGDAVFRDFYYNNRGSGSGGGGGGGGGGGDLDDDDDEDDIIPPKAKRRSDAIRDGNSDGSGSRSGSGGGSPSLRYRGKSTPSPGTL